MIKMCLLNFLQDDKGAMTLEAAVLTAAFVALAIAFRKQLGDMWKAIKGKNDTYIQKLRE